jgi:hypothetical protein
MQISSGRLRPAVFLGAALVLLAVASVLLLVSVGFGFAVDEVMVNPNARPGDPTQMEHAGNIALALFGVVEVALACVVVASGVLKNRLHWLARGGGAVIAGAGLTYLIVMGALWAGRLPPPLVQLERMLSAWVLNWA